MPLERSRYPRAAEYLALVPNGFGAYPECRVRADAFDALRQQQPQLAQVPGLPEGLRAFLAGAQSPEWLPEVWANTAMLLLRDSVCADDRQFLDWACADSLRLFQRPMYKALMFILSPALVVMGAAKRWGTFHQGSQLEPEPIVKGQGSLSVTATLTFPPNLFWGLTLERQAQAYLAALQAAGATEPAVSVERLSMTQTRFVCRWRSG